MQASVFESTPLRSWQATFGYCRPLDVSAAQNVTSAAALDALTYTCVGPWDMYLQSFYWGTGMIVAFAHAPLDGPYAAYRHPGGSLTVFSRSEQVLLLVLYLGAAFQWACAPYSSAARSCDHRPAQHVVAHTPPSALRAALFPRRPLPRSLASPALFRPAVPSPPPLSPRARHLESPAAADVTGKVVDIISNSDPDRTAFRNGLDQLNGLCGFHQLSDAVRIELREHYHAKKEWYNVLAPGFDKRVVTLMPCNKTAGQVQASENLRHRVISISLDDCNNPQKKE